MASIDPKQPDKRTVERYIRLGLVDEKEYEKYLKSLPDLSANALRVEETLDDDIDDDLDEEEAP